MTIVHVLAPARVALHSSACERVMTFSRMARASDSVNRLMGSFPPQPRLRAVFTSE